MKIRFKLNGDIIEVDQEPTKRLLDVLREDLKLIGPKEGCGEGECGACAVLLNGKIANSCMVPFGNVYGQEVLTIEGYKKTKQYEILEEAYSHEGAVQCGFCTPGMIIASESILHQNPHPTDEEIRIALSGNLCRCTGYNMIIAAVKRAAEKGEGLW